MATKFPHSQAFLLGTRLVHRQSEHFFSVRSRLLRLFTSQAAEASRIRIPKFSDRENTPLYGTCLEVWQILLASYLGSRVEGLGTRLRYSHIFLLRTHHYTFSCSHFHSVYVRTLAMWLALLVHCCVNLLLLRPCTDSTRLQCSEGVLKYSTPSRYMYCTSFTITTKPSNCLTMDKIRLKGCTHLYTMHKQ